MTPAASLLQPDSNPALYVSSVLTLYVDLPDTRIAGAALPSAALAESWQARMRACFGRRAGARPGHWQFDLPGYCLSRLHAAGVAQAAWLGLDPNELAWFADLSYRWPARH